jgi:PAS domain S-box-containing protein
MYRLLYVDDEPGLLEIGKIFLESGGEFKVDTLPSAVEALDHLKSVHYDTIISDYQMPIIDGIAFLKTLRSSKDTTPFIIFTGRGREEVVIEALNSGADFYLQKGGDPTAQYAELVHKIHHAIDRKQADSAFKKSERDFRNLVQHATEGIVVVQDQIIRMANPEAVRIGGYSEEGLVGKPYIQFVHPDDRKQVLDLYRKAIAGEDVPNRYSFRALRKDAAVLWIELSAVNFVWDERPATLNFMIDITSRKHAEDALRESEERYRLFFKTAQDSVFITTSDGWFIDCNDAMIRIQRATSREQILSTNAIEFYVHPEDRPVLFAQVNREGYVQDYPAQFRRFDGTTFDALISLVAQKNPDGSVKLYFGTVRDISTKK